MLRQSLTLMFALGSFGLLTGCGGTSMSGDSGTSKGKKKDDAVAIDAADPYVVTGAYLTCDHSPTDAKGSDAVGCSMMDGSGTKMSPTPQNKLAFFSSMAGGAYKKPDQVNSGSGHQAVFLGSKDEISKSRFLATLANRYGIEEVACDTVPCKKPVNSGPKPTYIQLYVDGIWRVDGGFLSGATSFFNVVAPRSYCSQSKTPPVLFGTKPPANFMANTVMGWILQMFDINPIESLGQLYAKREEFKKYKLGNGRYFETGEGCIVVPLKKTIGEFFADGMAQSGPKIRDPLFHLIIVDNPANQGFVREFIADIQ